MSQGDKMWGGSAPRLSLNDFRLTWQEH